MTTIVYPNPDAIVIPTGRMVGGYDKNFWRTTFRAQLFNTQNWAGTDASYGGSYEFVDDDHGGGATPAPDNLNFNNPYLPAGTKIKSIALVGKCNSSDVGDVQMYFAGLYPTTASEWESGVSAISHEVIANENWIASTNGETLTGDASQTMRQVLTLNHTMANDAVLYMAFRPTSAPAATRFFYPSLTIEMG